MSTFFCITLYFTHEKSSEKLNELKGSTFEINVNPGPYMGLSDIEDEEKEKNLFYSQGGSVILALLSIISSQPQLYAKLSKLRGLLAASQK